MSAPPDFASYPLSRDERAAMSRYVASIRQQLQEVSELFSSRYGTESTFASLSAKALMFATLLEDELTQAQLREDRSLEKAEDFTDQESVIVKTALQGK
jgi:hypothetical protein